jgi:pyrroloquinoline quinone biosynthesis protein D
VTLPCLASRARLKWDRVGRRYLLLFPERGLALSDTAGAVLKLCDGAHSVDDIVRELSSQCAAANQEKVRVDIETFLAEMRRRGLVEMR